MKNLFLYLMIFLVGFIEISPQGLSTSEPNEFHIGWQIGKFAPTAAGIQSAIDKAFAYESDSTKPVVVFAPGVYDLDSNFIELKDGLVFKFNGQPKFTSKHVRGVMTDDSVFASVKFDGQYELENTSISTKLLELYNDSSEVINNGGGNGLPWDSLRFSIDYQNLKLYIPDTPKDTLLFLGGGDSVGIYWQGSLYKAPVGVPILSEGTKKYIQLPHQGRSFFVDAVDGSDTNDGLLPSTAFNLAKFNYLANNDTNIINIIPEGDFEAPLSTRWSVTNRIDSSRITASPKFDSYKLQANIDLDDNGGSVNYYMDTDLDTTYYVSFYFQCPVDEGALDLYVKDSVSTGTIKTVASMDTTDQWTKYALTFTATGTTTRFQWLFTDAAGGGLLTMYIDDFKSGTNTGAMGFFAGGDRITFNGNFIDTSVYPADTIRKADDQTGATIYIARSSGDPSLPISLVMNDDSKIWGGKKKHNGILLDLVEDYYLTGWNIEDYKIRGLYVVSTLTQNVFGDTIDWQDTRVTAEGNYIHDIGFWHRGEDFVSAGADTFGFADWQEKGIFLSGDYNRFINNTIDSCTNDASAGMGQHCVYSLNTITNYALNDSVGDVHQIRALANDLTFSYNYIDRGAYLNGLLRTNWAKGGITGGGATTGALIENNTFLNTGAWAIGTNSDSMIIRNNLIKGTRKYTWTGQERAAINTLGAGSLIYDNVIDDCISGIKVGDAFVYNNTIKDYWIVGLENKNGAGRFLNNIVFTTRTDSVSTDATIDSGYAALMYDTTIDSSNYNLIYPADPLLYNDVRKTYAEWQGLGLETNSITANPLLDADYKPLIGSPAIGSGTNGQNIGATR